MERKKLILIGGGGHCKACIDVIEQTNTYDIVGILDQMDRVGSNVMGYQVIGTDADIIKYNEQKVAFFITLGQIKSALIRKRLFDVLKKCGAEVPVIISPTAYVSRHASVGSGTIIMHRAIVNAEAEIGQNCIVNTGAAVDHESLIGDNTHLSTFSVVNGNCIIGNEVFIGSNATIKNGVKVCDDSIVGAAAVVIRDIDYPGTYVGNPAIIMN